MFWVYRYKGFSFTAARTVHTALVLAGQQGCSQADTGHLLLALLYHTPLYFQMILHKLYLYFWHI